MSQLFKSIDEVVKYVPLNANMHFETIKPAIIEAEELFIKELLGEYYAILLADYTDNTNDAGENVDMNADNLEALPFVQRSLAYYASYLSVENLGVTVGDGGIQQSFSQNSQPAPRWKIRELQASYINKADRFADKLLEFLELNATAIKYGSWFTDASANTKLSGLIVYSTRIASRYIDINDSRRLFLRLRKRIKEIESRLIKSLICSDQYEQLITEIGTSPSEENQKLLALLEPIISKKALYETIPSLRISINPEGIHLISVTDSTVMQLSATDKEIENLKYSLRDGEFGYLADEEKVKKFIADNIADYPLIADSACYRANPSNLKYVVDNDPRNKHFSV
jgi:hypothetical protein